LNRRLGGIQSWSGCFGEEKDILFLLGIESPIVQPIAYSLLATLFQNIQYMI